MNKTALQALSDLLPDEMGLKGKAVWEPSKILAWEPAHLASQDKQPNPRFPICKMGDSQNLGARGVGEKRSVLRLK